MKGTMQTKSLYLAVLIISCLGVSNSQEFPKYEAFVGYSHLAQGDLQGWEASGSYNFNRWGGLKIDADGHYFNDRAIATRFAFLNENIHDILIGPQFSWRPKRLTLFAHVLLGYSRFSQHFVASLPSPPFRPHLLFEYTPTTSDQP
jgi:hypothetical protein